MPYRDESKNCKCRENYRKKNPKYFSEYMREWSKRNPEKVKAAKHRGHLKRKAAVVSHYSGGTNQCACCGESYLEFLTIDHINGGGRKHREIVGDLYPWLIKHGFPEGYRILCMNCNMAIANNETCPHEAERNRDAFYFVGVGC